MKHLLVILLLLVSLSFALAHDGEKSKSATAAKASCCMDGKKASMTSDKTPAHCDMKDASEHASMKNGKGADCCSDVTKGAKASLKKTGSSKIVKASNTDVKAKQAKTTGNGNGTN